MTTTASETSTRAPGVVLDISSAWTLLRSIRNDTQEVNEAPELSSERQMELAKRAVDGLAKVYGDANTRKLFITADRDTKDGRAYAARLADSIRIELYNLRNALEPKATGEAAEYLAAHRRKFAAIVQEREENLPF